MKTRKMKKITFDQSKKNDQSYLHVQDIDYFNKNYVVTDESKKALVFYHLLRNQNVFLKPKYQKYAYKKYMYDVYIQNTELRKITSVICIDKLDIHSANLEFNQVENT
jgi:hypothetical protein